ncbi:MAG: restriction endonuclease subunit S, partial [Tenuifilaceae bacterium]|nr:restriction endonuclease subunit S [Tenuifilaceae bacterium]
MKKYEKYKDSGIEWIGEIPEHWEVKRLASFGKFSKGGGVSKSELTSDGLPVILYGDIYTKYDTSVKNVHNKIPVETAEKARQIKKNAILFTGSGETIEDIGKCVVYLNDEKAYAGGDVIILEQQGNNSMFLSYVLNTPGVKYEKAKYGKGEIVVHIYSSQLREIKIPIPPPPEQTAIATYLDRKTAEIDQLIDAKKRLIELYHEEKTAIINHAVTKGINPNAKMKDSGVEWVGVINENWNITSLKRLVSTKITDGPHETPAFQSEGVPFVSVDAVKEGKIDFSSARGYISKELDAIYSLKCKPRLNDLFIVKSGSTTGKIAIVDTDVDFNIWSPLALVRSNDLVLPYFLFYAFQSDYFQNSIRLFWSFGTQPNIGMNVIENLKVAFPHIDEQQSIVHHIETECSRIDTKIERTQRLIELLAEYRTALISEVV